MIAPEISIYDPITAYTAHALSSGYVSMNIEFKNARSGATAFVIRQTLGVHDELPTQILALRALADELETQQRLYQERLAYAIRQNTGLHEAAEILEAA